MGRASRVAVSVMAAAAVAAAVAACQGAALPETSSGGPTATTAATAPSAAATGPAAGTGNVSRLFVHAVNLCTLIDTAAVNQAIGFTFPAGRWDGRVCNWEADGGREGMTVSVHPGGTASQVQQRKSFNGVNGMTVTEVSVPGAAAAALVSQPLPKLPTGGGGVHDIVFAAYTDGIIEISISAPSLTTAQAVATTMAVAG